jgi:hypothetical protein
MIIMTSCCLFIHMNVKEFKLKIYFEILGLVFNLGHLKVNTYFVERSQFCKGQLKGLI